MMWAVLPQRRNKSALIIRFPIYSPTNHHPEWVPAKDDRFHLPPWCCCCTWETGLVPCLWFSGYVISTLSWMLLRCQRAKSFFRVFVRDGTVANACVLCKHSPGNTTIQTMVQRFASCKPSNSVKKNDLRGSWWECKEAVFLFSVKVLNISFGLHQKRMIFLVSGFPIDFNKWLIVLFNNYPFLHVLTIDYRPK